MTRRHFLRTTAAAAGALALPFSFAAGSSAPKYRRYNVTSEGGKKALASYAKGVEAMLRLPADHPQNWFRNAFIHLMDCPHGNWWFYVWHRGYVGYFEETIRNLSGDASFAMPYWDWTALPQIPDAMFDGVLTPESAAFIPYTRNLAVFTSFAKQPLLEYWNGLTHAQRAQLKARGYTDFTLLWNDVTGYSPQQDGGISGNIAYANPCGSRYLTRDNPKLDPKTAYDVSPFVIYTGLAPTNFYNKVNDLSFTSAKTPSHNSMASGANAFSVLEGLPHNKVHNCIGGVGPLDPGPYGNMTNFLSPVDPVFFLHHANMDRLWDVWTRKQKALHLPYLPTGQDLQTLSSEPFLFYVNGRGEYVGNSQAGEYLSTERFDYDYEPGFGELIVGPANGGPTKVAMTPIRGSVHQGTVSIGVPTEAIRSHLAAGPTSSLIAEVTLARPREGSLTREFDVIVGAPADVITVEADSPYYAGTVAFFGQMMSMPGMAGDATFSVPLPKTPEAFHTLGANATTAVNIRLVPAHGHGGKLPVLKSALVRGG
ncbi:tyrosinase family protein [Fimbriimonas ginsengisoli]|uniref:Tyrosinase n=1 Tax=Fimbriimonas ginsengisoli Gsoil 348 TaxID=661478 RepID=A0A068NQY3_FIMGI|nr:tyrosinase family protein [Fimbriimonas ginsengisoli]AIE85851.1 tyrosinase [Fimbriimonas ginsengisoli Gsoil 348]